MLGDTPLYSKAFDVGDKVAMQVFADEVKAQLGNAHVVINNACISGGGAPVWALAERVMQINFFGVVYGTRAFLPQLMANGDRWSGCHRGRCRWRSAIACCSRK